MSEKLSDILSRVDADTAYLHPPERDTSHTLSELILDFQRILTEQQKEQADAISNIMHKLNSIATQLR